jgi:hypothetical protein
MRHSLWNIKIPTFAGLLLLVLSVALTLFLAQSNTLINIRANPSNVPTSVRTSNITDTSFTVSYITAESTTGSLSYGENSVGQVALDDRDRGAGNPTSHQLHYFTISNVKPKTQYLFTILSGSTTFNSQGTPFSVTTAPSLPANSGNQKTIDGTVLLPNGTYPKEAITYVQIVNSQLLSAPVQKDGSYHITLNGMREQALEKYIQLSDSDQVNLTFIGDGNQATATTTAKDATHIPAVTLSNQYSFTAEAPVTSINASGSAQPSLSLSSDSQTESYSLQIFVPQKNQAFTDSKPEFSGKALPSSSIDILIQSASEIRDSVQTDKDGNWKYRPSQPLDPGIHTLSITGKNASGVSQTIAESFIVYAAGSQFTEPSVSPIKSSPTPTNAITPISTIIPTSTQVATPSAVPSLIPSPTIIIPTPTTIAISSIPLSPQPSIVSPGSNELAISIGLMTFATIVSALLFFLIHV